MRLADWGKRRRRLENLTFPRPVPWEAGQQTGGAPTLGAGGQGRGHEPSTAGLAVRCQRAWEAAGCPPWAVSASGTPGPAQCLDGTRSAVSRFPSLHSVPVTSRRKPGHR